jgi:hypothetical protein
MDLTIQGNNDLAICANEWLLFHRPWTHIRGSHPEEKILSKERTLAVTAAMMQAPQRGEIAGGVLGDTGLAIDADNAAHKIALSSE